MTEGETIALITAMQAVIVAAITTLGAVLYRGLRKRTEAIRYDLTNDHSKPLRDDMDDKHRESMRVIRTVVRDIGGMREDVRQLRRDLSHTDERVDELEKTRPPIGGTQ